MKKYIVCAINMLVWLTACEPDTLIVGLGIDDTYAIARMQPLPLSPRYEGDRYEWSMPDCQGNDSIVATTRDYVFISATPGTYRLKLRIIDDANPFTHTMTISVWQEEIAYSRYISRVYEYRPAPGQFVGELPQYEEGDTEETMRAKVEEYISGTNDMLVSLGGFGGYVTFGFDHAVMNMPDSLDFKILGNAFYAGENRNPTNLNAGGSAEPGIVMVSIDRNHNGKPDDEWYELTGSEHNNPDTRRNYTITYHRTPDNHIATPRPNSGVTDTTYISWNDSQGASGYIERNAFHTQDYFPQWLPDDELTFSGTRLPDNAVDESGNRTYYVLYSYDWGYADNHPNSAETEKTGFDIDRAVDDAGNPIYLPYINFIRVYTGVNQQCGRIGETSTEICRAEDLHIIE